MNERSPITREAAPAAWVTLAAVVAAMLVCGGLVFFAVELAGTMKPMTITTANTILFGIAGAAILFATIVAIWDAVKKGGDSE